MFYFFLFFFFPSYFFVFLFLLLFFTFLLFFISFYFMKGMNSKVSLNKSQISIYECGYSEINSPLNFYSLQFFIVGLSFMLFDLEIILFIPILINTCSFFYSFSIIFLFFFLLMLGLGFEFWCKVF